ncbi:hypothetical protein A2U01_0060768, partial [Trifolium medium]|nr:hypothetical protein [Trifolium medium]
MVKIWNSFVLLLACHARMNVWRAMLDEKESLIPALGVSRMVRSVVTCVARGPEGVRRSVGS